MPGSATSTWSTISKAKSSARATVSGSITAINPEGHRRLFEIMERCDGERTVADIAVELDISFQSVWDVVSLLEEKGLVWLSRKPHPTDPHR